MDGNVLIADFVRDTTWDALPEAVQRRALLCLLDGAGAMLAGTLTPIAELSAGFAAATWPGSATIALSGLKASAAGAAFANGNAANALDIDDDAIFTRGHPGAQLVPATLAVGEQVGASGSAVLEALVIGYEVAIRAGRCWHALHSDYQSCGSWGSVACAAAAAHLLKLDVNQIRHALGIAEYHAPNAPMMRSIASPSMAKHAIGWGAMSGIISAELAAAGFTGIPSLLGMERFSSWVADAGRHYWMEEWVFYKGWCSCAWGHPACVAALRLQHEHGFAIDEIAHIDVHTFQEALDLHQGLPENTEQAQFSLTWPLACLLIDGELGPRQMLAERFGDPQVRSLASRISVRLDPQIDAMYDSSQEMDLRMHSAVSIRLQDGRVLESGIVERAADQWDAPSLERKFRWLVGHVLDQPATERVLAMLSSFASLPNVREFTTAIAARHPQQKRGCE